MKRLIGLVQWGVSRVFDKELGPDSEPWSEPAFESAKPGSRKLQAGNDSGRPVKSVALLYGFSAYSTTPAGPRLTKLTPSIWRSHIYLLDCDSAYESLFPD